MTGGGRKHERMDALFCERSKAVLDVPGKVVIGAGEGGVESGDVAQLNRDKFESLDTAIAATGLVFGGVLEQFPGLKVLLAHGCGTFPFSYPRLRLAGPTVAPR